MNSESLVCVALGTKFGVDIYSSKVIPHFAVYREILLESEFDICLDYKYGDEDDEGDVFSIKDVVESMNVLSGENCVKYFRGVYGEEFNSSDGFKIFDTIEASYIQEYGMPISLHEKYTAYEKCYKCIKQARDELENIYTNMNESSKTRVDNLMLREKMNECYKLLENYKNNEDLISKKTHAIILTAKNIKNTDNQSSSSQSSIQSSQSSVVAKSTPVKSETPTESKSGSLVIKRNDFGQYVYEKYGLVLDPKEKLIIGRPNGMGGIYPLDTPLVELCKKLKLKYKIL